MNNPLLQRLAEFGCAIREMLSATYMDSEDFYVRMLKQLPESTAFARLRASVAAEDVSGCFEVAHELKGLYSMLGLTPAYSYCCELVELTRPRRGMGGVAEAYARLEAVHDELVALINAS